MEIALQIIKGWLLAWFFVNFEPLQQVLTKWIKPKLNGPWLSYFRQALSCHKCMCVWIIGFMTFNLYYAIAGAVIAWIFDKVMNSFKTYL